jgi:hypothetical protein
MLQKELPKLTDQKGVLHRELAEIRGFADGIMSKWNELADSETIVFLKDKLRDLAKRRRDIENGIASLETMIHEIERETVSRDLVMMALGKISDVFDVLPPYRKKEMIRLVLHRAEISESRMRLALYGRPPDEKAFHQTKMPENVPEARSPTSVWLPVVDTSRTLVSPAIPPLARMLVQLT